MRSPSLIHCLLLFAIISAGCASTTDLDAMRNDINQLKRETFEVKRDMGKIREQVSGAVKEESFNAIRESQASLNSQLSELSKEIQVLRGRFDENKFFVDKAMKDSVAERELFRSQINNLEMRIKELNDKITRLSETKVSAPKATTDAEGSAEKAQEQKGPDDDPKKAYEAAYNLFKEKKYKEARERFNDFIKRFPKDDLADNAQFWIGESYYAEKDYEGAILSYETLIKQYPHSEKVPGALLKQGMAFAEIGDKKTAKVLFERLIEKYPASSEAAAAKKKKAEIEARPQKTQKRK
ncbi:MAG: tol-pal system protein YbgF [Thermodesulfovibrionales bacterium]